MIDFGGWQMPVQYSGIIDEHQTVRNAVGVFDISHMGQIVVSGANAQSWLNSLLTNNIDRLEAGESQYTFLLNHRGGVIDDLIAYRIAPEEFLLVVNAARTNTCRRGSRTTSTGSARARLSTRSSRTSAAA